MPHPIPAAALETDIATLARRPVLGPRPPTVTPTQLDYAYVAGFIDGEGTVFIGLNKKGAPGCLGPLYNMRVMIAQDDVRPLVWARERWGGSITAKRARENGKIAHSLSVFARNALPLLRGALPFLILKREQAELAILFQERRKRSSFIGQRTTDEERAFSEEMRLGIIAANRKAPCK